MRHQLTNLIAGISLVAACAGCGSGPVGDAINAKKLPSSADPCAGIRGCDEVAVADVDGDGTPDRIGISVVIQPPPPKVAFGQATITASISTAGGLKRIDISSDGILRGIEGKPDDHAKPYVGAYRISRTKGADLVIETSINQGSYARYAVIGWSGDRPALVSPPEALTSKVHPNQWILGSSEGSRHWVSCADGAAITATLLHEGYGNAPGAALKEVDRFVFHDGDWMPNGSDNLPDNTDDWLTKKTPDFDCPDQAGT